MKRKFFLGKEAQTGPIIIHLAAIGIIFVLLGVSFLLFLFMGKSYGVEDFGESGEILISNDEILLAKLNVEGKEMLLVEGLVRVSRGEIGRDIIEEQLVNLLDEKNNCLAIGHGYEEDPMPETSNDFKNNFYVEFKEGEIYKTGRGNIGRDFNLLEDRVNFRRVSFFDEYNEEPYNIVYYYGGCKDE